MCPNVRVKCWVIKYKKEKVHEGGGEKNLSMHAAVGISNCTVKKVIVLKLCIETLSTVKIVNFAHIHCVEGKEDNVRQTLKAFDLKCKMKQRSQSRTVGYPKCFAKPVSLKQSHVEAWL